MGRRGKRLLALLFLCNALVLLIGEAKAFGGPRGGPPQALVQKRRSFSSDSSSDSWSFFNIGSSRNKRKLPSGKETISDFSCRERPPGYYADIKLGCEVYHLCNRHGGGMAFECPRGTKFQQRTMVCDHEHLVECHKSAKYFHSNLRIGQPNLNFIDDKKQNDVFMQVVVKDPDEERHENMQLVFKNPFEGHVHDGLNHIHEHEGHNKALKGRGKDTFFLGVAQDFEQVIRDSRKVPKNVLNQLKKQQPAKPVKLKENVPSFPNYPVKMEDQKLTFHQAFGTDFDPAPKSTTTQKPNFILTPPEKNAPVADFYGAKKRKQNKRHKKRKNFRLPKNHPLRQVLPPSARVVGIQPLRKLALSNRDKNAEIMTLGDFLKKYPNMEKMKTTSIVPVPVTDQKHIRMIERLASAHQNENDLDEMFKELEQLISKRAERKISFVHSQQNKIKPLNVRPRGGLPGPRFMTTSTTTTTETPKKFSPRLEFGFVPIITTPQPILTTTKRPKNRFTFDQIIDETDQLVAPRLPRQPLDIESNEIEDSDAFFFTTTTAKPGGLGVTAAASTESKIQPGIFDMRKFFFIPKNLSKSQAERRVHHLVGYPPHPHRGFFRG